MEVLQYLPIKIQEKIYKYYVREKLKEKRDQGWEEVHVQILLAPYCQIHKQIVKITICKNCGICSQNNLCYSCFINGERDFVGYHVFDTIDFDEMFLKYI